MDIESDTPVKSIGQQSCHQTQLPQMRTSTCHTYRITIPYYGGISYGSSTGHTRSVQIKYIFNTCEHQALPLMKELPMQLMVGPQVKPVAYHTPVSVPLHWQDKVKSGLDQNVKLGVLDPVPIGEPVKWCHHMVVCAKKNGTPRRTVDFQALNAHAIQEAHHTLPVSSSPISITWN